MPQIAITQSNQRKIEIGSRARAFSISGLENLTPSWHDSCEKPANTMFLCACRQQHGASLPRIPATRSRLFVPRPEEATRALDSCSESGVRSTGHWPVVAQGRSLLRLSAASMRDKATHVLHASDPKYFSPRVSGEIDVLPSGCPNKPARLSMGCRTRNKVSPSPQSSAISSVQRGCQCNRSKARHPLLQVVGACRLELHSACDA